MFVVIVVCVALALATPVLAQQPPSQASCETRMAVVRQNASAFMNQIFDLEALVQELRQQVAKVTQERDAAQAQATTPVPPAGPPPAAPTN